MNRSRAKATLTIAALSLVVIMTIIVWSAMQELRLTAESSYVASMYTQEVSRHLNTNSLNVFDGVTQIHVLSLEEAQRVIRGMHAAGQLDTVPGSGPPERDSWGHPYNVAVGRRSTDEAPVILAWSNGPDGMSGTGDDIVGAEEFRKFISSDTTPGDGAVAESGSD